MVNSALAEFSFKFQVCSQKINEWLIMSPNQYKISMKNRKLIFWTFIILKINFFFSCVPLIQFKAAKVKGHLQRNSSIRSEEYRVVGDFEHSIGISRWAKLKQGPPCICVFAVVEFSV